MSFSCQQAESHQLKTGEAKDMIHSINAIACYSVIFWAKPLSVFNKSKTLNKDNRIPKY
jgi:hypothetical protein